MATRHELIHIDFVANAGKANPVLKSLQASCNDARIAKEQLDAQLKDAKAMNAPAEVITDLEKKLKSQTTTWQQLERGLREYTKGIDTLSKGIKEFNDGTLDEMSAKFNKAVYNAAKLAQSAVKTGSSDWNQLQRLMDATDRNVTRAREDIDLMMQSLKDGSAVSTVQLTRSREVLEDLARLAVTNSEEWRGLRKQFNEVDAAIASVAETERRLKGEIATENDAIALSNSLTKESIALRHADGEAAMKTAQAERKKVEDTMRGISDRIVLLTKERDGIQDEIELQENLNGIIKERNEKILSAQNRKQDAEQRKAQAQATIKEYEEQEKKVQELKLQKKDLEEQQKKETREAEKSAKATEEQNKKQAELAQTVSTLKGEIGGLETTLQGLEEQIKKTSAEPIKPKVDTSKIEALQAKLKAVQDGIAEKNAQIEAASKKGGLATKWQETLTRLQGDKDGRLSPMGLGDDKKQMDDILDVANNFYEIIKKVKGVTEDGFIPTPATEPIKQLAEYYKITEEEARKLVKTLRQSEVVNKKFGTFDYNETTGFLAINKNKGKDDQQIRIEAAQSYMEAASRSEANQTEKVNKLLADKKKLEEEEVEIKGKLQAATEGVAEATVKSGEATEKKAKLTKKEQQEVKNLTKENETLTGTIEELRKKLDSLPASQDKAAESAKKGAEAVKKEAEAMKMTAEDAKDALAKMQDVGTVKAAKNGPLEASNLEGAQQALFGIFKGAGAAVGNGTFTLTGQDQIRKAVKAFQDKFHIDDDKYAKELMTKLATGKNGGLIRHGVSDVDPITHKPLLQISRDEGAWKERLRLLQEYRDIQAGVTTATKEQTAADKAQEDALKSLREAYQKEKDALARRNEEYQKRLKQAESMSGPAKKEDGTLTAKGVELEKAEEYRQKYVVKQQEKERKAWEEYQAAKSGDIDVEKSRKQIEEQILTLEQQKTANTERLTQLQEKGTKATKEQVKADGEAVTTGKNMNELLQEKERITASLTEKQAKLKKAQEDLTKMTKEETAADKEQSSVTEELTKKTEEYNAETEKLANMKEGRDKARGVIRNADRSISNADDAIATLKNEPLPQRKSEAEVGAMKKRVAELTAEVEKETAAFNKNAQAITELNKKETDAAIEMAQSENVSIEKVKQSIELLQKKIQTEATDTDTMKQRGDAINRLTERLTQMNAEVANLSKPIADRLSTKDLGALSETEIRQGIDAARELLKTYEVGSDKAKELTNNIARADQYLRDNSVEAARQAQKEAAQLQLMTDRMQDVSKLSTAAVTETKRFWETMAAGAERGSKELAEYEGHLKAITEEEQKRRIEQVRSQSFRVKAGLYGGMDENELRESINAAREYQKTLMVGSTLYNEYSEAIAKAEKHLRDNSVETERAKLSQQEMNDMMRQQLNQGTVLTESALKAQVNYWQRLIDDPKTAAESLDLYKENLKEVQDLQQQQANELRDTRAARLDSPGNFSNLSEQEIREAIEAGKQLIQTYETGDARAKTLGENIVRAEEHLKQYGLEAARTAQREAKAVEEANRKRQETNQLMEDQLRRGTGLTESALKQQEQYWQRLIDDPKAAANEIAYYIEQLNKVKAIQDEQSAAQTKVGGLEALKFFRGDYENGSADEIKKQADALKKYRDSLPQQDQADTIEEINELLVKAGAAAQKAAGETMTFKQALRIGMDAKGGNFKGTVEQLTQAKKTLEQLQQTAVKGGLAWRRMQDGIDNINLELKRTSYLSKEVQDILDKPKGRSLNALKQAVEQGRAALQNMDRTTEEGQKAFDELAKKIKATELELKQMSGEAKATTSAFDKAWSRLKTYVGLYVGASVAMNKLVGTMGDLMDLSDKMGEVRKTTGFTADEVGRLSGELKKFDTRTTLNGLLDLSVAAGQLGLKTEEDVLGFTEAANKLMVALPEMGREGATEMLKVALATGEIDKIRKQMEQGLIDGSSATAVAMEKVGSTIDRLRATSAATAPAITDFVKRVGAVGAQSGITIDQVAALGSTVDALGMRVEMSATALSRMIPAIKNNAFDVAKAIGVTPDTLRTLFDTGRGMEAILMIFQHIKDAGMGEDDIESMLGMGNMKEVMKELNQMGARAGIVFSGLSQNVDELRRQLGVAGEAYEQNIAIQQEYDKMNETTLAKWERLKNTIEEAFVGDFWQRQLGNIIDGIRSITDFITGDVNPALKTVSTLLWMIVSGLVAVKTNFGEILFLGAGKGLKSIKDTLHYALLVTKDYIVYGWKLVTTYNAQERAAIKAAAAQKGLNKAMLANVWTALAVAVGVLIYKIYEWNKAVSETEKELARMSVEEEHARHNLDNLVNSLNKAATSADVAKKKHEDLKGETEALRKEVDTLSKSADKNSDAKSKLSEKTQELEKKEKDLKAAEDESNKANGERLKLINEINSKYSTYLGYMLTEATNAEKVASAHQLIIAALKEEMRQKGIARKQQAIDEKYQKDEEEYSRDSWQELNRLPRATQQRIMDAWTEVRASITSDIDKNGKQTFSLSAIPGLRNSGKTFNSEGELKEYMKQALAEIVGREVPTVSLKGSNARYLNFGTEKKRNLVGFNSFIEDIWGGKTDDGFGDWATTTIEKQGEITRELQEDKITKDTDHRKTVSAAVNDINTSFKIISETTTGNQDLTAKQINTLAENVNAIVVDLKKYNGEIKNVDKYVGKDNEVSLENAVNTMFASLTEKQRKQILDAARRASRSGVGGAGGGGSTTPTGGGNVWGSNAPADSTDYGTWDVNELVARRNQMDKFKNVLKPDTDIRAVLAEDKALMKALDNGLKEDWKSVIGWYNTERKKIQEELKSERFSTNEGHWRDEKQGRGRRNRFRESDYALAELDRYYSKRKEDLEKARIEENMSEELFNRQAELLEQEHLERRSKLRETFTAGSTEQEKKMVKQFREWWDQLEKQGLLDEVPWATVESEWSKALASEIGRNNLRAQQDLTKLQEITVKHLNEIAKLIDKERPYDGITANLRKNLTEMDILLADMQKDGPEKDTAKLVKAETMRLKFLLSEAEQAYSLNFEQLKEKMIKEGFGEWAQAIEGDEQLKQSLMQNLRNTYDAIQEAINKESSIIKKQLEIQWNDLMQGSDMSMKGTFEKAISDLGLAGDQVKRANSLIGAGTASDRVADKLAIQQMRTQLQMQETYFALMQKIGRERIKQLEQSAAANEREAKALKEKAELLRKEGKTAEAEVTELKAQNALRQSLQDKFDAEHAAKSLSLARTKELAEEEKQRVAIANQLEESQNRLYTELKSWAELLSSSMKGVMEASHAGDAEYYNELAKLNLTGKGGPGAGTYIVIENEGTEDATAHYEYLNERQALERQREIENDNAVADAWRKVMDDINQKMNDAITDQINAMLQNASTDANTDATLANTRAIAELTAAIGGQASADSSDGIDIPSYFPRSEEERDRRMGYQEELWDNHVEYGTQKLSEMSDAVAEMPSIVTDPVPKTDEELEMFVEKANAAADAQIAASDRQAAAVTENAEKQKKAQTDANNQAAKSTQSSFAKMVAACNMYGIAYQAMSNDNLDATEKFQMFALQAAGQTAIGMLTTNMLQTDAQSKVELPGILGKAASQLGPIAGPIAFAAMTALLGGLMGMAISKVGKAKSQISQVTGASVSAGRLSTGMLTYAEGNVNEFTDPGSLTPGRSYNVDAADGKTYRAKYTGRNPKTHLTNGPEFHLSGEKGREMIIDAGTTRQITMNEAEIWHTIQTLSGGGRLRHTQRRGRGVRAFADGNIDEFEDVTADGGGSMTEGGMGSEQMAAFQSSLDRNNELLERALTDGIHARFDVYGKGGLIDSYDKGKKNVTSHGEKY